MRGREERYAERLTDFITDPKISMEHFVDLVCSIADNNAIVQRMLFIFLCRYIGNRAAMYISGRYITEDAEYIGRKAVELSSVILDGNNLDIVE